MTTPKTDPQIDWAARADGEPHTLIEGKHYTRSADQVRQAAAMWGLRHDLRAVSKTGKGSITIQFLPRVGKV